MYFWNTSNKVGIDELLNNIKPPKHIRAENLYYFLERLNDQIYIIFSSVLTTLNVKPQNYNVVYLIESYNFYINYIFVWIHSKKYDFHNTTITNTRLFWCWKFI
jgi:hypothetical protein